MLDASTFSHKQKLFIPLASKYFKNNIKCLYAPLILVWPLWTKLNSAVVEINQMSVSQYFNSVSVNLSPTHCQCYTSALLLASL